MTHRISNYYDRELIARDVSNGQHRLRVGGLWEEVGRLQFEFLKQHGMQPSTRLLDIGCGCFRGGVHLVHYLDPAGYYGIDISQEMLDAGYERELSPLGLDAKLPRENLLCSGDFEFARFGVQFDMALAQSLFTHLPLNHIRLCMERLTTVMRPDASLFATVFLTDDDAWSRPVKHWEGRITSSPVSDPYHYRPRDLAYCVEGLPWRLDVIGDWGHPRDQSMVAFTRLP